MLWNNSYRWCLGALLEATECGVVLAGERRWLNELVATDETFRACRRCVKRFEINTRFGCELESRHLHVRCHPDDEFECEVSKRCIPRRWVRDGTVDCSLNDVSLRSRSLKWMCFCVYQIFLFLKDFYVSRKYRFQQRRNSCFKNFKFHEKFNSLVIELKRKGIRLKDDTGDGVEKY